MTTRKSQLPALNPEKGLALYGDGSSDSRNKSGGWAWIAFDAFHGELSNSGGATDTTNNRMEMMAWIEGLQELFLLYGPCRVIVYSDSQYVGLGAMDRTRNRNKNKDLWEQLDRAIDNHSYIEFEHVRGHNGNVVNELVDKMAKEEMRKIRDKKEVHSENESSTAA